MSLNTRLPLLEQFPAPKLNISERKISLRGFGLIYGNVEISNAGEGNLVGSILPVADFLSFSPKNFEGNRIDAEYTLDLTGLSGEIITSAVVVTNGGEKTIDFHIAINPPDVLTWEGYVMTEISDFASYAREHPIAARSLFGRQDFMLWLINMNYPAMDIYERFIKDPNKERALDNFLVFNGAKVKAKILAETKDAAHSISISDDVVTGSIVLRKTTWGFAEAAIEVEGEKKWIKLDKNKITSADFDSENLCQAHYIIFPEHSTGRETAVITLNADGIEQKIHIRASFAAAFSARLDKQSFFFEDKGKLIVENNTGHDLLIDISCENFVKFAAKRYHISKTAEIDFEIKFSSFKTATMSFKRQNYAESYINVVSINGGKSYSKKMQLTLWGG
ncbi:MAG: DUF5717 family protein [Defluviitaleaceae bacterium]|nr:DUF5717 family protein [Defluviitaleaceae bacterium]